MQNRQRQFSPTHTKTRRLRIAGAIIVLVAIFAVPAIRTTLHRGVSMIGLGISGATHGVGGFFGSIATDLRFKHSLVAENAAYKAQIEELTTRLVTNTQLARENAELKASMGRTETPHFTLAAVIAKPPHSAYDTMIIDGGSASGFAAGQTVYANGETPIGTIDTVMKHSAIVRLFSAPGEETTARLSPSNIDVTIVGRGGGNFAVTVPHDLAVTEGAAVVTKDISQDVIGIYKKITSDARDPFQTLLLVAPLNINELAYVQVKE